MTNKYQMSPEHEQHLESIKSRAAALIDRKYREGQKEHGGNLWEVPGLIDEAIKEAIDQVVYLLTLKDQIGKVKSNLDEYLEALEYEENN